MKYIPKALVSTADISRGKPTLKSLLQGIASAVITLVLLYLLLGLVAELAARKIPDRWERKMKIPAALAVKPEQTAQLGRAQEILDQLMRDESFRGLDYRLFLLEMDAPNAVAVPGGGIGVSQPLLAEVKSDIGLAFVLAHELGHHQNRDMLRGLGRRLLLGLIASIVFNHDGLSPLGSAVELAEMRHSRKQERAADEFALQLVHKKYGTTAGAMEFFEKLQAAARHEHIWQKYAGSHPLTTDRLEDLRKIERGLNQANTNSTLK